MLHAEASAPAEGEKQMSGYQFFHIEGYARVAGKGKAGGHSVASIMAEARRDPGACPHVPFPQQPRVIFGDLLSVEPLAHAWADQAVDQRGHKMRKDGLCLLAGVISAPRTILDWKSFRDDSRAFLEREYGDRLKCVVEHRDEKERHIHFYAVPRPGEGFSALHRGRAAAEQAKAQGRLKGEQNREYKSAMRLWQDQFFLEVASLHGLTRIGPGRRRLTRDEWKAEQEKAKLTARIARENKMLQGTILRQEKELERYRKDPERNPLLRLKNTSKNTPSPK